MIDLNPFAPDRPDPPEYTGMPKLLERIFHAFMVMLLLGIVFVLSRTFVFLEIIRNFEDFPVTGKSACIVFIIGGFAGAIFLVRRYFSKPC